MKRTPRAICLILLGLLSVLLVPGVDSQTSIGSVIVNPGFENPGEAWQGYFVYGGGVANASDTTETYGGTSRAARLYAPVSDRPGAFCDQAADAVSASVRQPLQAQVTVQDIVNSPGSFSVWWYVLPDGDAVYSVRAIIGMIGVDRNYRVEYSYGVSGLQNTSTVLSFDLGPIPATAQWFQTRRNLYSDLQSLGPISTVRVADVRFAVFGNCVSRGEIAWVDNARLFARGNSFTAPKAEVSSGITSGPVPLTVTLRAVPGDQIESYSWAGSDGARGSGIEWTHTFSTAGEYTVTLRVEDSNGDADVLIQPISVSESFHTGQATNLITWIASGGFLSFLVAVLLVWRRGKRTR